MKVDVIASEQHYLDHMLPIFECLPTRLQGHVFPLAPTPRKPLFDHVAMVAGWQDVVTLKGRAKMIYVEHGCGQAYLGDEKMATLPGYSGGAERHPRDVIGYICPSETVAARWSAPAVAVGCPRIDLWHEYMRCGGMPTTGAVEGHVREALHQMAEAQGPADLTRDDAPDGAGAVRSTHREAWAGRLLDLAGLSTMEQLRAVSSRQEDATGPSGGVASPSRDVADVGSRSHMSQQRRDMRRRGGVRAPEMREPTSLGGRDPSGQSDAVIQDGAGSPVSTGALLHGGEHVRNPERQAAVSSMSSSASVVGISFHWECVLGPEMRSARGHYWHAMPEILRSIRDQGFEPLGHAHPRDVAAQQRWADLGVPFTKSADDVFALASMLIMDNSSLMYEFASLRRPVIALNAPWYRRNVEHGLRFWSHVPGIQVDSPEELLKLDLLSHLTKDPARALRNAAVAEAYAFTDGGAAPRAAAWITQLLDSR